MSKLLSALAAAVLLSTAYSPRADAVCVPDPGYQTGYIDTTVAEQHYVNLACTGGNYWTALLNFDFRDFTWNICNVNAPFSRIIAAITLLNKEPGMLGSYNYVNAWTDVYDNECSAASGPVANTSRPGGGQSTARLFTVFFWKLLPPARASVLVHEARHTDRGRPDVTHLECGNSACDPSYWSYGAYYYGTRALADYAFKAYNAPRALRAYSRDHANSQLGTVFMYDPGFRYGRLYWEWSGGGY